MKQEHISFVRDTLKRQGIPFTEKFTGSGHKKFSFATEVGKACVITSSSPSDYRTLKNVRNHLRTELRKLGHDI